MSSDTHTVETKGGMSIRHAASNRRFNPEIDTERLENRAPIETMPNNTFQSSNVHSGLFDFGENVLWMRYLREGPDAIYKYISVPTAEWQGLVQAASKGSYINANVAFEYQYFKVGRDDFPDRTAMGNDRLRRFVYDP